MIVRVTVIAKTSALALKHIGVSTLGRVCGQGDLSRRFVTRRAVLADQGVRAGKAKAGAIMIKVKNLCKILGIVTGAAGLSLLAASKLLFVNIIVAVDAKVLVGIGKLIHLFPIDQVTSVAADARVLAIEWKTGLLVKGSISVTKLTAVFDDLPTIGHVATVAAPPSKTTLKGTRVRIGVTALTASLLEALPPVLPWCRFWRTILTAIIAWRSVLAIKRSVALEAAVFGVLACKRVIGVTRMVKP